MGCRRAAVVVGLLAALAAGVPAAASAQEPPPAAAPGADALAATGAALRAERAALLERISTLTDEAEGAHARFVAAQQRVAAAEATAAGAERSLTEHAIDAFVHNGSLVAAARARGGIFAEVVVDVDRAIVEAVAAASITADAERSAAGAALDEARRVEVEVAAARQALEATIEVNEARTAEARAEEERNALARRLAEEEQARQEAEEARARAVAEEERARALAEEERTRRDAVDSQVGTDLRRLAGAAPSPVGAPSGTFATLPGTPTGESGGLPPAGGYTGRHLDRFARATAGQADLMVRHPFGPVAALPPGATRTGQVVEGMASWYGPGFDGRPTASGALFDQQGWTVASKELPLGTVLLLTRGDRSVLALVNDRGPYVSGRVLDLSRAVAAELGTIGPGVASVRAEVVQLP